VSRRLIPVLLLALVPALLATGCGGGGGDGGGKNKLSTDDQLRIAQDRADIDEFCSVSSAPPTSDLYDRAYFAAIDAVNRIIAVEKSNPNAVFHDAKKGTDLTMRQIASDAAKKLDTNCGKDGKAQAAKLKRALQSS
jgi:hypothetical protein